MDGRHVGRPWGETGNMANLPATRPRHSIGATVGILAGYVGGTRKLDAAIGAFADAYAAQTRTDYQLFVRSVRRGSMLRRQRRKAALASGDAAALREG